MFSLLLPLLSPKTPAFSSKITDALSIVLWIVDVLCVLAVIVAGGMMALASRRGEGGEHAGRLGWIIAGAILVGSAAAIANAFTGQHPVN